MAEFDPTSQPPIPLKKGENSVPVNSGEPDVPPQLAADLAKVLGDSKRAAPIEIPPQIDQAVMAAARMHFRAARGRSLWFRRLAPGAAVAAVAALLMLAVLPFVLPPKSSSPTGGSGSQQQAGRTGPLPHQIRDVNGDGAIDIIDALYLTQQVRRGPQRSVNPIWDVNGDGQVDQRDADELARMLVALPDEPAPRTPPAGTEPADSVRFATVDVMIDPKGQPLAAYQFNFSAAGARVLVVGIENGAAGSAFDGQPPYYDRKVDRGGAEHVIVAAYNAGNAEELASSKVRVTTLHLQITGAGVPQYQAILTVAGDPAGHHIPATLQLVEGNQP
jgi:hypothetical protein